jgi:DNA-binding response OmpR family regulator
MTKILVIDDDALLRNTISKILRRGGYEVVTAEDGVRGMAAVRTEHPDLVITDIVMPKQEGTETIAQIRREARDTKIIAVSGGGLVGNVDLLTMAQKLGAHDVLAKPFLAEELIGRVRSCLAAA